MQEGGRAQIVHRLPPVIPRNPQRFPARWTDNAKSLPASGECPYPISAKNLASSIFSGLLLARPGGLPTTFDRPPLPYG